MLDEGSVGSKTTEPVTLAYREFVIKDRGELRGLVPEVSGSLGSVDGGHPIMVLHLGAVIDSHLVQVGCPVDKRNDDESVRFRRLEPTQVMTALHRGPYESIRESYLGLYGMMRQRGVVPRNETREVICNLDPDDPTGDVIEIQWPLHDWTGLMASSIEEVMGPEARDHVMQGVEAITPESTKEERFAWVKEAIARLDGISSGEQRYWALSRCADVYPRARLEALREVYLRRHRVDDVMEAFATDTAWYSTPHREGDLIYHTKVPWNREAWEAATDRDERRRAYCHCALVQDRLDETPPSYCYCGTGWVRQLWEHVLDQPVLVEVLKCLPAGDDECQFLIHLPPGTAGDGGTDGTREGST